MKYSIEIVKESSQELMLRFLKAHENYTLFLLGNFENYGGKLTEAPYSGNFKLIFLDDKIIGVFCLTRNGTLLIESIVKEPIFDLVLDACQNEKIPLKGIAGKWEFCCSFWEYIKAKKMIKKELFNSKEILYSVNLQTQNGSIQSNVRLLRENDFDQWKPLRLNYLIEEGVPNDLTNTQLLDQFIEKTTKKISWGLFLDKMLVSMADLNAKALDLGQVGGVYTAPQFRRKGYSRAVMKQLLHDAKELHSMRKLIIFTGENNTAAQKLYSSLGAIYVGYFALLLGESF